MFLDWKNQYCQITLLPKAIYRCNAIPIKLPMVVLTELGQTTLTIFLETQQDLQSKSNLEKENELEESTFLNSDYSTKLQSTRQYGTGNKPEIQTDGTRQKAQR